MQTATNKSETKALRSMPATAKAPEIASASVSDTLVALHLNPATGLTHGEVETSRKEHGYNEVAELKDLLAAALAAAFFGVGPKGWAPKAGGPPPSRRATVA
jgi:H+-transporting ATPase